MSICRYVRKKGRGYEYGYMKQLDPKKNEYSHEPLGSARTYEEALAINEMASSGLQKTRHFEPVWRDL